MNGVTLIEQQFGEIASVLSRNTSYESSNHESSLYDFILRAQNPVDDTDGQLLTLFALATSIRGKHFLELGVRHGRSTLPILMAAHAAGGHLTSVDNRDTTFLCPFDLADSWSLIQQDTVEYLSHVSKDTRFDLVFVDDWHAYPHVKKELELLDPLVGPGSLILLHDTMHGHTEPFYNVDLTLESGQWAGGGPYRAIAELPKERWEFATLPWWHGLTILRKKYSKDYHRQ